MTMKIDVSFNTLFFPCTSKKVFNNLRCCTDDEKFYVDHAKRTTNSTCKKDSCHHFLKKIFFDIFNENIQSLNKAKKFIQEGWWQLSF